MNLGDIKSLIKQKTREVNIGTGKFDIKDSDLTSAINAATREVANVLPVEFLQPLYVSVEGTANAITSNSFIPFLKVSYPADFLKTNSNIYLRFNDGANNYTYKCYKTSSERIWGLPKEFVHNVNYYAVIDQFVFDDKLTNEVKGYFDSSGSGTVYLTYFYVKVPDEMINDTDTFPLHDRYVPLVVANVAKDLFLRYEMVEEATVCLNEYQTFLSFYLKEGAQNAR